MGLMGEELKVDSSSVSGTRTNCDLMALTEPFLSLEEGLQTSSESGEDVYMEDAVGVEGVPVIEEEERHGLWWQYVRWLVYSLLAFTKGENIVEACLLWVAFLAVFYFDFIKGKNKKTLPGKKGLLAAAAAPKAAPEEGGAADIV